MLSYVYTCLLVKVRLAFILWIFKLKLSYHVYSFYS